LQKIETIKCTNEKKTRVDTYVKPCDNKTKNSSKLIAKIKELQLTESSQFADHLFEDGESCQFCFNAREVLRWPASGRGRRNNPNRCDFFEYFWQMLPTLSNGATIRTVAILPVFFQRTRSAPLASQRTRKTRSNSV
jgi:hypothetical protein